MGAMNKNKRDELPGGWGWVRFGDVVYEFIRGPFGSSLRKEFFVAHGYKVYEQQNAIYKTIELGRYFISDDKFQELKRFETKPDDYILSCSGTIGKLYKLPSNAPKGIINQALLIIRIRRAILLDKYFSFLFTSIQFQRLIIKDAKGTAMLNLAGVKELELVPFPICSLPEQHAIVSRIEQLFSELDKGIESLKTAQQQLKVYRQSVLKSAFEGKLTNENVKEGELPEGWKWAKVKDIGKIETGTTPSKSNPEFYANDFPFFKPTDLEAGINVSVANDNLSKDGIKQARYLKSNSILVTCIGATIGKTGLIKVNGACNQQINSITPHESFVPEFVYYQVISHWFQEQIKMNAVATTLPILNKSKFEKLDFIYCPKDEQYQIVQEIESRLSECDNMEATIAASLQQAEACGKAS